MALGGISQPGLSHLLNEMDFGIWFVSGYAIWPFMGIHTLQKFGRVGRDQPGQLQGKYYPPSTSSEWVPWP